MKLIITDAASPDFNSYVSPADLMMFADTRGHDVPGSEQCNTLLFQAMDYLNGLNWQGVRSEVGQPLPWPRRNVFYDEEMLSPVTIPQQLKQAQCRLALAARDGELEGPQMRGLIMETAGKVSLQYSGAAESGEITFPWMKGLLRGLLSVAINTFADRG